MKNWFATRPYSFKDALVHNNSQVLSSAFLLAAEDFISILDKQTNPVFYPVKAKYRSDLDMIMRVYTSNPEIKVRTLADIIEYERLLRCRHLNCSHATHGIVMLSRAFCFIYRTFDSILSRDDVELNQMFQDAYYSTLGKYHDAVSRNIFGSAIGMCPSKQTFFRQLQCDDTLEQTKRDAITYFAEIRKTRDALVYICRNAGWDIAE